VLPRYSDVQLDQLLRRGIHPTRNNLWSCRLRFFRISAAATNEL
jgi:hypothetical protein